MALHSSTLAWKIQWMEEPGSLQSMGLLRVGQRAASLSLFTFMHWWSTWQLTGESQGDSTQMEKPRDGGAWWAAVYGVAQSQTRLKRLSTVAAPNILYGKKKKALDTTLFPHRALTDQFGYSCDNVFVIIKWTLTTLQGSIDHGTVKAQSTLPSWQLMPTFPHCFVFLAYAAVSTVLASSWQL